MKKTQNKYKSKYKGAILLSLILIVVVLSLVGLNFSQEKSVDEVNSLSSNMNKVTLYKDPNCGCCDGHAHMYEEAGFEVEVVESSNMNLIKEKFNISRDLQSCHTALVGDYVVEGHVPFEGIEMLIEEQPDIVGIALPGMPIGTPGMPGMKTETFKIRDIETGEIMLEI